MIPVNPHSEAGCLIEPPVSVAVAAEHKPAATEVADPPEDPPGPYSLSQGFLTSP